MIRAGDIALDLGCAPGSWLQVITKLVGEEGRVLGIDLQNVDKFAQKNITTFVGDMTVSESHEKIKKYLSEIRTEGQEQEAEKEASGVW